MTDKNTQIKFAADVLALAESITTLVKDYAADRAIEELTPEGFTPWTGGVPPVPDGTMVDVIYRDGLRYTNIEVGAGQRDMMREATRPYWRHDDAPNDIVAYRVVGAAQPEIPEGFTPWTGGEEFPIDPLARVEVVLRDGEQKINSVGAFCWKHSENCSLIAHTPNEDIIFYREVHAPSEPKPDPELYREGQWYPWNGGDQPVFDDTRVRYLLRDGYKGTTAAMYLRWSHNDLRRLRDLRDIVAFKIKPSKGK